MMRPRLSLKATVHKPGPMPGDPLPYAGEDSFTFVLLRIEDADGAVGYGTTGRFLAEQVAGFLNTSVARALTEVADAENPLPVLMSRFNPRGMTGVVVSSLSALDIALTDLRARRLGQSVAALLGGARQSAPVHVTCGFPSLDRDALVAACRREIEAGAKGVKVLVASKNRSLEEDVARLQAVRAEIGPDPDLIADANCGMDLDDAQDFLRAVEPLDLAWMEEPVHRNDRHALAALAASHPTPIGAGQMEQSADRFDLLCEAGVSVLQPNAVFAGGFGAATSAATRAIAQGRRVSPAGGWDTVNLHWMCGALSDGAVELHRAQARIVRLLMPEPPAMSKGHILVPGAPGLGFDPDDAALAACRTA